MKAILIDDERKGRETLKKLLETYCPEVDVVAMAPGVEEGYEVIRKHTPDIVFLDIEMPGGNGFELLEKFDQIHFQLVFTTAYDSYALKAIKVHALDYLLKPIDPEELVDTVKKAAKNLDSGKLFEKINAFIQQSVVPEVKKITLKTADSIHIVQISDIVFCEASGNYTTFYLIDKRKILVSRSLGEYEELIADPNFMRIHQSFLVNLSHVRRYDKGDGGSVITVNEHVVPVSTRKKEQLMQFLQRF